MKKHLKKTLSAVLSLAMIAGSIAVPMAASAEGETPIFEGDTVLKEWKFDFGAEGSTPEDGYTLVTPDTSFVTNKVDGEQYGFLGIGEEDYKLTNRYDGWTTQKGQVIELAAGGGTGLNDAVGVVGAGGTDEENKGGKGNDIFGNKGDVYYPTRFALKVADDTYYRIRATVTTLDPSKDAEASLYTERKHPLYTKKTIAAGTSETTDFTVRVTPIYYEKEAPTGQIKDEMVTVGVLGENTALVSLVIQQVETAPTVWVLGDSTVTDGNTTLPFFLLQNYTGVGTGLTKYLRRDYAMVNEGEGGLNAADNNHFNMVKTRIKAGDYMYVEYGHNHKSDGPTGYKGCLDKYYNACHAAGAKLIIVSPVQSDNDWDDTNKKWKDRFGGETNFAGVGKAWVAEKVAKGATDVAFADLTKTSVAFVDKVTADGGNLKTAAQFYYQTPKGGGTDPSHPNDAGAENFAYCFFEAAKENDDATQKAVLADLLANMTDETPNLVSADVVAGGLGGTAWPQYIVPTTEKYPVVIDNVEFNEDGTVKQVDVTTRDAEIPFATYGIIVITIYNTDGMEKGKIYAADQVDHSTGKGPQTVVNFRGDITLAEGDSYSAVVVQALDSNDGLQVVEGGTVYSAVYKPTEITEHLILNEDGDGNEDFDYFGISYDGTDSLSGKNSWRQIGSAAITANLYETSDGMKYAELTSTGKKADGGSGSFYYDKAFAREIGTTGRYVVSSDMQFVSGGGMTVNLVKDHSDKKLGGAESLNLFNVSANGDITRGDVKAGTISATAFTNVQAILDMDLGTLEISVGGNDAVTIPLENYQTESTGVTPSALNQILFSSTKEAAFDVKVSNLTVAALKDKKLPEYTIGVRPNNPVNGSVELSWVTPEPEETEEPVAEPTTTPTNEPAAEPSAVPSSTGGPTVELQSENKEPAHSGGGSGFGLDVDLEKATITSYLEEPANVVLIRAKYDNGKLQSLKSTPVTLASLDQKTVEVKEGEKIMLWNSLEKMEPLTEAMTVPSIPYTEETLALNTVVTAKAIADKGYVCMGWLDENGKKVSDDAEYTFRLRGNEKLTANFVKEPGVEDVKLFTLTADKTRVKAAEGAKINISVTDAKDAANTPISAVTNDDAKWSCDDSALTIENGVVTIPQGYTAGEAKKTVTVTAELNGISKTIPLNLYSSAYYEDFSEVTDVNEWITSGSTNSLNAIVDTASDNTFAGMTAAGNGKVCVIGNNSNGPGKKLEYTRDMELSKYSVLKFGFEIEPHQIRMDGKDAAVTLQFVDTDGAKVFDISVDTSGKASKFNGTAVNGFVKGTAVAVDTELDFTNKTMKYTLTDASGKQLATGTAELTANNLDRMYFSGDWQYGKFAIDNIYADYTE